MSGVTSARAGTVESREGRTGSAGSPTACPTCAGTRLSSFVGAYVDPRAPQTTGTLYYACGGCGTRFQELPPDEDGSIYANVQLPREQAAAEAAGDSGDADELLRADVDALAHLERLAPGRRLLDVGSGDGSLLIAAVARGFSPTGVDISPELAALAGERSGAPVYAGALQDLQLPAASFDIVNLDMVLMYVPEPGALLREVARLLAPGGSAGCASSSATASACASRGRGGGTTTTPPCASTPIAPSGSSRGRPGSRSCAGSPGRRSRTRSGAPSSRGAAPAGCR